MLELVPESGVGLQPLSAIPEFRAILAIEPDNTDACHPLVWSGQKGSGKR